MPHILRFLLSSLIFSALSIAAPIDEYRLENLKLGLGYAHDFYAPSTRKKCVDGNVVSIKEETPVLNYSFQVLGDGFYRIEMSVVTKKEILSDVRKALGVYPKSTEDKFKETCGDLYVSELIFGGRSLIEKQVSPTEYKRLSNFEMTETQGMTSLVPVFFERIEKMLGRKVDDNSGGTFGTTGSYVEDDSFFESSYSAQEQFETARETFLKGKVQKEDKTIIFRPALIAANGNEIPTEIKLALIKPTLPPLEPAPKKQILACQTNGSKYNKKVFQFNIEYTNMTNRAGYKLVNIKNSRNGIVKDCGNAFLAGVENGNLNFDYQGDLYIECANDGDSGYLELTKKSESQYTGKFITTTYSIPALGLEYEDVADISCTL